MDESSRALIPGLRPAPTLIGLNNSKESCRSCSDPDGKLRRDSSSPFIRSIPDRSPVTPGPALCQDSVENGVPVSISLPACCEPTLCQESAHVPSVPSLPCCSVPSISRRSLLSCCVVAQYKKQPKIDPCGLPAEIFLPSPVSVPTLAIIVRCLRKDATRSTVSWEAPNCANFY